MSNRPSLAPKALFFTLLSGADFALTRHLLQIGDDSFYEWNGAARWCLDQFGWGGLAAFKAVVVASVLALAYWIYRYRSKIGHRVLTFGCLTVSVVVLYSIYLVAEAHRPPAVENRAVVAEMRRQIERMDKRFEAASGFRELQAQLADDLVANRRDLSDTVDLLADSEHGRDSQRMASLRCAFIDLGDRQCLAISLINLTVARYLDAPDVMELATRLQADFRSLFGIEMPISGPMATVQSMIHAQMSGAETISSIDGGDAAAIE